MAMSRRSLAHVLLLGTVFVWGATFTLVKSALVNASPLLFNLMRMGLATLALLVINWRSLRGVTRGQVAGGALIGVFMAAGYQLQTLGLARTTPAKSAFLTGLVVVFVPLFTLVPALRPEGSRRPGVAAGVGAGFAFLGLLLLTTPAGTAWGRLFSSMGVGDVLTLGCAVAFAAHLLTLGRYSQGMGAGVLATLQVGFCTVVMGLTVGFERPHVVFTPRLWMTLAVCSLLATAAAFTIQTFAQQVLPPTHTVVLLTLEPVFAALTSVLVFGEAFGMRSLVGAGLILVGIVVVEVVPGVHALEIPA